MLQYIYDNVDMIKVMAILIGVVLGVIGLGLANATKQCERSGESWSCPNEE